MSFVGDATVTSREGSAQRSRAALLEQAWIWSVVGYTVLRFVIAWSAFSEHGANVWIFGLLDVGTAWPYAKAVAVICRRAAAFEWPQLPLPLVVALASFFAPYGYLWFAAGAMPAGLRAGLALCVGVLATAATFGVVAKVRRMRASELQIDLRESLASTRLTTGELDPVALSGQGLIGVGQTGVAVDDIVIDLRFDTPRIERASDVVDMATPTREPTG